MFCSKCGKGIDEEALICVHCGVGTEKYRQEQRPKRPIVEFPSVTAFIKKFSIVEIFLLIISIMICILFFVAPIFTLTDKDGSLKVTAFNATMGKIVAETHVRGETIRVVQTTRDSYGELDTLRLIHLSMLVIPIILIALIIKVITISSYDKMLKLKIIDVLFRFSILGIAVVALCTVVYFGFSPLILFIREAAKYGIDTPPIRVGIGIISPFMLYMVICIMSKVRFNDVYDNYVENGDEND
ncbi:MAG: zinc ribbon domain-containing protein [Oscillospiraceae bacterium]|nr:zinc ribbon domain-containing protein [Oscillospiraceae bacterium]